MRQLNFDLGVIQDFIRLASAFATIEGFLDPCEGYLLYRLAAEGPGLGAIVEIGSFCGRSTAYLAAGSRASHREKVVAIDHFQGSPEHQVGQKFASTILAQQGTTFHCFCENLRRVQLLDHVDAIKTASMEAVSRWQGPIRLLFIDGDHAYESVRGDFDGWMPFVVPGGLIAMHDIRNAPGVTRLFEELIGAGSGFKLLAGTVSLRVVQKC